MRTRTTYVYVYLAEGPVPAGRLNLIEDGRNSYATFQYGERYLERPDRIAVDPAALALPEPGTASWEFRTAEGFALFNGIRDAAPDAWGRYLMQKAAAGSALEEFDYLVASGDHRVGALAFGPDAVKGPKIVSLWGDSGAGDYFDLQGLADAADRAQSVDRLDPELKRFLGAGSSLGGARPKAATIRNGVPWIAKFSVKDDLYPVCRTELAAMRLAKECGLDVPETDIATILGRDVYLIRRFDRVPTGNDVRRVPYASALTMLEALEIAAHRYAYRDLADAIRRFGSRPREDLRELYRRMVFNILVGNDDDHLRNHAFLFDGRGWRLSPLYDVVPRPKAGLESSQVLAVGEAGHVATLANALSGASAFGLRAEEALTMVEGLHRKVQSRWESVFRGCGIGSVDIERLYNSFEQARRRIQEA
jgi:serine/threonine-protein kinase HipA